MSKPVLAIETSNILCGACVYFNEEKLYTSKIVAKHSHSEMLFKVIDDVIKNSGIRRENLASIAVSAGPGSFTGLRIGMSAAKGISFGLSAPIIPVPTFEALALQLASFYEDEEIVIANKINTEEVYFARFHVKSNNYIFTEELKILRYSELKSIESNVKKFGNMFKSFSISSPEPEFIARWAINFGEKVKTEKIDDLEPYYLKNFIVKERQNAK
jgi:tRNA threonylcarbamoyladenosine biosynthesis protein TsaB